MTSPDFAAAQQRILARRAAANPRSIAGPSASTSSPAGPSFTSALARLPSPLRTLTASTLSLFATLQSPYGTRPSFRVGQLDAELLDEELLSLFRGQVGDALKYFGTHLADDWSLEISAGLRSVLWWLSIWGKGVSYGGMLQGLRYVDARGGQGVFERMTGHRLGRRRDTAQGSELVIGTREPSKLQKVLYGLLTVGGRYGWEKWEDWLVEQEGGYETTPLVEKLSRMTRSITTMHEAAALASFLVFLYNGRYRTLIDRLLGFRLVPTSAQTSREVSFEYLNRQLVWHAFTEFLLFILPLVGISRWRRWLARAWKKAKAMVARKSEEEDEASQGELGFLPERTCAICYKDQNPTTGSSEADVMAASSGGGGVVGSAQTDITNPYEAIPCGCVYCFVCLAHKLEGEDGEGWTCLRCGELVKECKPWSGDVIEESTSPSSSGSKGSRKSVVFVEGPSTGDEQETDHEVEEAEMLSSVEPMPIADPGDHEGISDQDTIDEGATAESAQWVTYDDDANDQESTAEYDDSDGG